MGVNKFNITFFSTDVNDTLKIKFKVVSQGSLKQKSTGSLFSAFICAVKPQKKLCRSNKFIVRLMTVKTDWEHFNELKTPTSFFDNRVDKDLFGNRLLCQHVSEMFGGQVGPWF